MRIDSLQIDAAPGLPNGLPKLELDPGLTVIVGPNASGKSTLARALRELLWPDAEDSGAQLRSHWHAADSAHTAGLFAGRVHWDPQLATPVPAGAAGLARFGVHSLLTPDDGTDEALGRRIALDLAGGLDFAAALEGFDRPLHLPKARQPAKARELARRSLQQAKNHTRELAGREADLADLAARIETAEGAGQRVVAAERLLELVAALEQLTLLESQTYAPGLEQLEGDESERIQALGQEVAEREAVLSKLETELEDLERTALDNAFPEATPEREALDTWGQRLEVCARRERELEDRRAQVASAAQRLGENPVGIDTDAPPEAPPAAILNELAQSIAQVRAAQAELKTQRSAVTAWESWAQAADGDRDTLIEVIGHLRTWLRSPGPSAAHPRSSTPTGLAWMLILAGLLCPVAAALSGLPWLAAGLFLAGAGAALLWSGRQSEEVPAGDSARPAAQRAVGRSPHAPATWEVGVVEQQLADLQRQLTLIEQATSAARELEGAQRSLREAEDQVAARTQALRELAAESGATQEFVELGDLDQILTLINWLNLRDEHARLATELEQLAQQGQADLGAYAQWLQAFGGTAPVDVAAASASLTGLRNRREDLLKALEQTRVAERARIEHDEARNKAAQQANQVWERAGVERGDLAALAQRLEERKSWAAHRVELDAAQREVERCSGRFTQAGELPQLEGAAPESVTSEQVRGWIGALAVEAQELGDLSGAAGGIRRELEIATSGNDLEDALAEKLEAEQVVAAERELAVVDALARGLLEEARAQHETTHAPPTLQRAQERFARFTHGGWRLEIGPDRSFRALDLGTGQSRSLAQLSDGTRAQLLLAVRLAALEELEPEHEPLPVCLDEALSISDPVRFHEIASALLELADGGRQILYFTANPGEAAQWRRVCDELGRPPLRVLDLATLPGAPADWGGQLPELPPELERVPDPAGKTPGEYAALLDVRAPDGFDDVAAWHLYLAAYDDLPALAACLRHHLKTIGHWREACRREVTPSELSPEVVRRLSARADLAAELTEAWRIGRGHPVTWDEVKASGAVSSKFGERVLPLLAEHTRDPQRFVTLVGEVKGFRDAQLDKLRAHLEQEGCLSPEPILSDDDLVPRTLQAAPEATALLGTEQAASFVAWLVSLLRA